MSCMESYKDEEKKHSSQIQWWNIAKDYVEPYSSQWET